MVCTLLWLDNRLVMLLIVLMVLVVLMVLDVNGACGVDTYGGVMSYPLSTNPFILNAGTGKSFCHLLS